jgi:hypothetical protein
MRKQRHPATAGLCAGVIRNGRNPNGWPLSLAADAGHCVLIERIDAGHADLDRKPMSPRRLASGAALIYRHD